MDGFLLARGLRLLDGILLGLLWLMLNKFGNLLLDCFYRSILLRGKSTYLRLLSCCSRLLLYWRHHLIYALLWNNILFWRNKIRIIVLFLSNLLFRKFLLRFSQLSTIDLNLRCYFVCLLHLNFSSIRISIFDKRFKNCYQFLGYLDKIIYRFLGNFCRLSLF